jgi:H+/Cl- antiporter ClcA
MAGGFASVFGTPMAAAVFSMEVLCVGRWNYASFLPAMVAALAGHWASLRLGVEHTDFPTLPPVELSVLLAAKWIVFAVGLWAVVLAFVVATHAVAHTSAKLLPHESLRMGAGGAVVVLAWLLVGTDRYLGLGMPTILQAVHGAELPFATFALKALFTAVTVGVGFMGGEVTPLFFIGATYGLTAGHLLGIPGPLAAAVGLSAAYGIAANTPVAFLFLAVELFGRSAMPHTSLVLALGFVLMRGKSIFSSQRHAHA